MTINQDRAHQIITDYLFAQSFDAPEIRIEKAVQALADAGLLAALPDTIADGDKLREITRNIEAATPGFPAEYQGKLRTWARRLNALLPAPAPRTLADMTEEEREACQWSLVETPENEGAFIKQHGNEAMVIYPSGRHIFWDLDVVVPMLDMPRLEWPGHHPATEEDVSIIPPKIDTSTRHDDHVDMKPEDVPAGEVWVVTYGDGRAVGMREYSECRPWYVMWDNQDLQIEGLWLGDKDITLVSRLVPEEKV